jgi:hypothetical protein
LIARIEKEKEIDRRKVLYDFFREDIYSPSNYEDFTLMVKDMSTNLNFLRPYIPPNLYDRIRIAIGYFNSVRHHGEEMWNETEEEYVRKWLVMARECVNTLDNILDEIQVILISGSFSGPKGTVI